MIFFNDPLPLDNPAEQAVRMCIEMHTRFAHLMQAWSKRGHELDLGIGIAQGYATLGVIGFEGRQDYVAGAPSVYGQSITDACISLAQTQPVLEQLARARRARGTRAA